MTTFTKEARQRALCQLVEQHATTMHTCWQYKNGKYEADHLEVCFRFGQLHNAMQQLRDCLHTHTPTLVEGET